MCTAIECPPTPPISNGSMISYAPDNTRNFSLGTIATYSCMIGFSLVVSEVRTCMEDDAYGGTDAIGIWVGQPPTCTRKLVFMRINGYKVLLCAQPPTCVRKL